MELQKVLSFAALAIFHPKLLVLAQPVYRRVMYQYE